VAALGLPLIALPPYAPELNPAERFFQELRRAVEGEPYASLDDKVAAVQRIVDEWDADPARVRSLSGGHWIEDAARTLPTGLEYAA
jgi:transposase